jgi:HEPN domain-containing protein
MNPLTAEWVRKAEEDFAVATVLNRLRTKPVPDTVCFHCQQCAEKYLKGRLHEAEIAFPKTHNLNTLLDLVLPVEPLWEDMRAMLHRLSLYAIWCRYPGEKASATEAHEVMAMCRQVRHRMRISLGLEPPANGQPQLVVREKPAQYRVRRVRRKRKI